MATASQQKALDAAHRPAARKKATKTIMRLPAMRAKLAKAYGETSGAFTSKRLLDTIDRHEIPLAKIPEALFSRFPSMKRKELLAKRSANGHDRGGPGIGIPLDAIPERKKPGERGPDKATRSTSHRGHPNSELIGKVIDLLAKPDTDKARADRLLAALDKLLSG